jgi:N-acyl-D-amino-acid deacylase
MYTPELPYDVILRNGRVVDGSGGPAFTADVALRGDRIARVGNLGVACAIREIEAKGLAIAPGFIDVHTHDDAALIEHPQMTPKLTQGVTTVIGGNCGMSGAPCSSSGNPPDDLRLIFKSNRVVSPSFDEFARKVRESEPSLNAAFLTGHTTLRLEVMGTDLNRAASPSEVAAMRDLLTQCLEQGALGLSAGLFYSAARAASTEEIIGVAQALSAHQGLYVTHMRNEGDRVMESLQESLQIARAVESPLIISHHKCLGRKNFGRSKETLAVLREARRHQRVAWDVYPYTAGSTVLSEELVAQSSKTVITWCDPYPEFSGQDLETIRRTLGRSIPEVILKLQPAGALYFMMDEADVRRIMRSEQTMIGSDGLPGDKHPHPRLWGTFPRVLGRYVREQKMLTLEDAVYRMTGLSANNFGLQGRGYVRVDHYADLCVFDPDSILDSATYEQPTDAAVGIHYVFVNGQLALENGVPTSARAGRILRRTNSSMDRYASP